MLSDDEEEKAGFEDIDLDKLSDTQNRHSHNSDEDSSSYDEMLEEEDEARSETINELLKLEKKKKRGAEDQSQINENEENEM